MIRVRYNITFDISEKDEANLNKINHIVSRATGEDRDNMKLMDYLPKALRNAPMALHGIDDYRESKGIDSLQGNNIIIDMITPETIDVYEDIKTEHRYDVAIIANNIKEGKDSIGEVRRLERSNHNNILHDIPLSNIITMPMDFLGFSGFTRIYITTGSFRSTHIGKLLQEAEKQSKDLIII